MQFPVFEDIADPSCGCPVCEARRRREALARRAAAGPGRARRTAVTVVTAGCVAAGLAGPLTGLAEEETAADNGRGGGHDDRATFAGIVLAGEGAPADALLTAGSGHAQGEPGPLLDPTRSALGRTVTPAVLPGVPTPQTRDQIIARARTWVDTGVSYSQSRYYGGYRTDCSGYVSMAWNLGLNAWTGNLADYAVPITKGQLQRGDILLSHNAANPVNGSHVVIFDRWADDAHTRYYGYEQTPPRTTYRAIPDGYFSNAASFRPYRYKYLVDNGGTSVFPGTQYFGPGQVNDYVNRLGQMLAARGGARFYPQGPGPVWGDPDREATAAFQRAQGWTGAEADGIPGPDTWNLLVVGAGKDIPPADVQSPAPAPPSFPGAGHFGPGQVNDHITVLGRALVAKGYGRHYAEGPGPVWTGADRLNVQEFQRAQGWTGAEADGIPGPDTWRLLMS